MGDDHNAGPGEGPCGNRRAVLGLDLHAPRRGGLELLQRAAQVAQPVRLADERLTTVVAQRSLREAGVRAKNQRGVIDQAAAVRILESYLRSQ